MKSSTASMIGGSFLSSIILFLTSSVKNSLFLDLSIVSFIALKDNFKLFKLPSIMQKPFFSHNDIMPLNTASYSDLKSIRNVTDSIILLASKSTSKRLPFSLSYRSISLDQDFSGFNRCEISENISFLKFAFFQYLSSSKSFILLHCRSYCRSYVSLLGRIKNSHCQIAYLFP